MYRFVAVTRSCAYAVPARDILQKMMVVIPCSEYSDYTKRNASKHGQSTSYKTSWDLNSCRSVARKSRRCQRQHSAKDGHGLLGFGRGGEEVPSERCREAARCASSKRDRFAADGRYLDDRSTRDICKRGCQRDDPRLSECIGLTSHENRKLRLCGLDHRHRLRHNKRCCSIG